MYVEMPILLNVNMGGAENLNFYVNAGPYIAYAVSGQVVGRSKSVLFEGKQGVSISPGSLQRDGRCRRGWPKAGKPDTDE